MKKLLIIALLPLLNGCVFTSYKGPETKSYATVTIKTSNLEENILLPDQYLNFGVIKKVFGGKNVDLGAFQLKGKDTSRTISIDADKPMILQAAMIVSVYGGNDSSIAEHQVQLKKNANYEYVVNCNYAVDCVFRMSQIVGDEHQVIYNERFSWHGLRVKLIRY